MDSWSNPKKVFSAFNSDIPSHPTTHITHHLFQLSTSLTHISSNSYLHQLFWIKYFPKKIDFFDHLSTLFNCWSKLVIWSKSRQMAFRYSSPWEKRSSIFWWRTSFAITWEIYLKTCCHFLHHYQEHKLGTINMSPTQCSKFNLCLQQDVARTATTSLNN
jgi:hypothetical protein